MYRFSRILVAMGFSDHDAATLKYAGRISHAAHSERAYFVHVVSTLDVPDWVRENHPELAEPVDETAVKEMCGLVEKHFDGWPNTKHHYEVKEGSQLIEILRLVQQKELDLVITGSSTDLPISRLPEKLARKAPCSVLIVPQEHPAQIKKILIPVDFSENSADAADAALAFAEAYKIPKVHFCNVYNVPSGFHRTGKSYEEFGEIMKKNAKERLDEFVGGLDLRGITPEYELVLDKSPTRAIRELVEKQKYDLLVVGARGRSATAAVLLGSLTEQLITTTSVPLLAVKKKGSGMGVLRALLEL